MFPKRIIKLKLLEAAIPFIT